MSAGPPTRKSPVWTLGGMVLVAWVACGIYRHQVAPLTVARAVLRVPSATDLETLCQRPEIYQAAVEILEAAGDVFVVLEQGSGQSRLSGVLTATKLTHARPSTGANPPSAAAPVISTETWELTYRTPLRDRALDELNTLISVLEQQVRPASPVSLERGDQEVSPVEQLEDERQTLRRELEQSATESASAPVDPSQWVALQERVRTLQRTLTEARNARLIVEEEWKLVEQECRLNPRLVAVASRLSPGLVQEAVLQIERQRTQSAELTRLNETEQRLENVYGDNHPKLVELRKHFEQLLSDLGGWEQVLDESHVGERLEAALGQILALRQRHEADLQTQLELEQAEFSSLNQSAEQRNRLTARLEQLDRELLETRQASPAEATSGPVLGLQRPAELSAPDWHSDIALLMSCATAVGLSLGWLLHRSGSGAQRHSTLELGSVPVTSVFTPSTPEPAAQLNLAQRRALRQARLQHAYAT